MTKGMFTSNWAKVKPSGCYVYLHKKTTDGTIFYVGKGSAKRAWSASGRSIFWNSTARKHGVCVDITQDGMEESDAFLLEMWLIAKLKHNNHKLTNLTNGGEGAIGVDVLSKIPTYCSNGMVFESRTDAAVWATGDALNVSALTACISGRIGSAFGFVWGNDASVFKLIPPSRSKTIINCSNGMKFVGYRSVYDWICDDNIKLRSLTVALGKVFRGEIDTAYGYSWWRDGEEPVKYVNPKLRSSTKKKVPVFCSNGMKFDGFTDAAKWVTGGVRVASAARCISMCCHGQLRTSNGFKWSLQDAL